MQIIAMPIGSIHPYKKNPRIIKDAVEPVKKSIQEFGFKQPIVVDKFGEIIIGHVRYEAAKALGMKEVPCVVADNLSDKEVKELRIVDNKTRELSRWDIDKLMDELKLVPSEINMEEFGFSIPQELDYEEPEEDTLEDRKIEPQSTGAVKEDAGYEFKCPECGHEFDGGVYLSF